MARVRHIKIQNFRCIRDFEWRPAAGINCLVGPGDTGKSSILDAIDFCIGARRTLSFTDADFYRLNVAEPLIITVTVGELDDALKSMEAYGAYLRSFNAATGEIEDEPEAAAETVLSVRLKVGSDLEPIWTLVSDRAEATGQARFLAWSDRVRLAPTRVGALADHNLAWRRGSVLNRLSDERPEMAVALAEAARTARAAFGERADAQLGATLRIVEATAQSLGISIGEGLKAMLDAHSVSFTGGTIALHGADGVPLRALGTGSTRLLLAGLQRQASQQSTVVLIDELEHGLEPHRIIRLLGSIGAKDAIPPLQAFVTTHSPVAIRELRGDQVFVVRKETDRHTVATVGVDEHTQGTIRLYPEAFLASSVIVCEGASEVGLLRGLDLHRANRGELTVTAAGVAWVDAKGIGQLFARAAAFQALGYRVAVLRDDDVQPDAAQETAFLENGGAVFRWRDGCALEDELFRALSDEAVIKLVKRAIELLDEALVNDHIQSATSGKQSLAACLASISAENRDALGKAARSKRGAWFKSVTKMEEAARDVVFPNIETADGAFRMTLASIQQWIFRDA